MRIIRLRRNWTSSHYLRSAMTGADIEMIDVTPRPLPLAAGDVVIVATDGIHSLEEDYIARIIDQTRGDGADEIAKRLVRSVEALKYPNQDNTTVIAIVIGDDAP
jgi:PPM family protein phosphatase